VAIVRVAVFQVDVVLEPLYHRVSIDKFVAGSKVTKICIYEVALSVGFYFFDVHVVCRPAGNDLLISKMNLLPPFVLRVARPIS